MKLISPLFAFPHTKYDVNTDNAIKFHEGNFTEPISEEISNELKRIYSYHLFTQHEDDAAYTEIMTVDADAITLLDSSLHKCWILLYMMAKMIEHELYDNALAAATEILTALQQVENKKDKEFQAMAALLLYYLAFTHYRKGACDNAEKELVKAQKIFEKLAKSDSTRYSEPLVIAVAATTAIFKSRMKQLNTLAHYQAATATYEAKLGEGTANAIIDLVNSLQKEGDLLSDMGNNREAVKYYTKAIRYLNKVSTGMEMKHLRISINMGKALLNLINRQDTGMQLLTSLKILATKLGATDELAEIESIIANKPRRDIIGMFKKIFVLAIILMSSLCVSAQLTIGHRGSIWGVENTRAAFINGAKAGFKGLECDIKVTKDGRFVISHDDVLKRLNPDSVSIPKSAYSYLQQIPLSQVRRDGKYYEGNLCTLEEYLDICNEYDCFPVIEIKWCSNIYSNNSNPEQYCYDGIPALMKVIEYKELTDKVVFLTSMRGVLAEIRKNYPSANLQLLTANKWEHLVDFCVEHKLDIDIRCDMDTTNMVETFHKNGLKVNVWCANSVDDYKKFVELGVDYITTDFIIPENKQTSK